MGHWYFVTLGHGATLASTLVTLGLMLAGNSWRFKNDHAALGWLIFTVFIIAAAVPF